MSEPAPPHQIEIVWKHRRLRSDAQMEQGRAAALQALKDGKSRREAAQAFIQTMYEGRWPLFDGFFVIIDGETFE